MNATTSLNVEDCYVQERRLWLRVHEKNGKVIEMPCNHNLERYLYEYIDQAGMRMEFPSLVPSTLKFNSAMARFSR